MARVYTKRLIVGFLWSGAPSLSAPVPAGKEWIVTDIEVAGQDPDPSRAVLYNDSQAVIITPLLDFLGHWQWYGRVAYPEGDTVVMEILQGAIGVVVTGYEFDAE